MKKTNLLKSVAEEISPTKKETASVREAIKKLTSKLKSKNTRIVIGGSHAKGTAIKKETKDIDVYVAFNYTKYKSKSDKLGDILEAILKKKKLKISRLKGSRDYFSLKQDSMQFEIVPILNIQKAEQAFNITDISPLHVTYIKKKTKNNSKLADEIRLAKAFAYGCDCYGAESYIRGFSGYALEVLTAHYGSFMKLARATSQWTEKKKIIVDPTKHYKTEKQTLLDMNISKQHAPLILVDPVQAERNVTAALSLEKFMAFGKACKTFLTRPSRNFFFKKELNIEKLRKTATKNKAKFILLQIKTKPGKEDIVGAKLKKFFEMLSNELQKEGFPNKPGWKFYEEEHKAVFYFIVKKPVLPIYKLHQGPFKRLVKHATAFRKKWKSTQVKKDRLYARVKRKHTRVEILLKALLKQKPKYVKSATIKSF